ncbi:MAG TPA: flagellar biosynthetic protein FliQ, partial [Sphingobium sp.]
MENSDFFMGIAQQALWITALATAPILIPALVAGLLLGMIQAATSI